tara:strand:+ start:203 stop:385 length:183 start_codon:yes stop_codon:yes gene_type:complete
MSVKKNKKTDNPMPSSSAGLLRFFEDETSKSIKIRPELVIGTGIALMVLSIIIRVYLPVI